MVPPGSSSASVRTMRRSCFPRLRLFVHFTTRLITAVWFQAMWVIGGRLESDHAGSIRSAIEKVEADPATMTRVRFLGYRADVPDLLSLWQKVR